MASEKLRNAQADEGEELNLDMSPMIDLVFLLLIFFMVSSHLIIVRIDKNVKPSIVKHGEVAENSLGRIVINVYGFDEKLGDKQGKIFDANGDELDSSDAIEAFVDEEATKIRDSESDMVPKLHLRADRTTDTRLIKKVVQASAKAGVIDVIFGSYKTEKD
ncbi:MAG: biopolymer transporter ExbD [Verrucomicrobiae bacterium]|nr:biopolymer transporter ExbD [Verrucomicrobiae bacterium]MCB1086995.1 biopolymer transporter ExbD [Verrucomicrobiae bacterium]MCB1090024.1 biopolymer transporter ExbD [Verrucomicrobiae bacterium]